MASVRLKGMNPCVPDSSPEFEIANRSQSCTQQEVKGGPHRQRTIHGNKDIYRKDAGPTRSSGSARGPFNFVLCLLSCCKSNSPTTKESPVDLGIFSNPSTALTVPPQEALRELEEVSRSVSEATGITRSPATHLNTGRKWH